MKRILLKRVFLVKINEKRIFAAFKESEKKIVKKNLKRNKSLVLTMNGKSKVKPEPTFEEAYAQLQAVLRELNDSQVPLEKLVVKYSQARDCLEICRKRLGEAELEVKKLGKNGPENFEE